MFAIPIRGSVPLALSAAFGCTPQGNDDPTEKTSNPETSGTSGTTGTTGDVPTTTMAPSTGDTGSDPSGPTSTSTGDTGTAETGPAVPEWCNGFNPRTEAFTVLDDKHDKIVDGSTLRVVCGGQGSLMIPVYPQFGGFTPMSEYIGFDITLDVEGYNVVNDHFVSEVGHAHKLNCADEGDTYYGGYRYSFIPMFPPDSIPEINVIDGKAGHLHLTLHAPDGDVEFDADVVMAAMLADDCGY